MGNSTATRGIDTRVLRVLQALGDERRLRILDVLRDGEHCVCDLQASLGLGQSLLSHHLRVLREAGLVAARREGRWAHYSLTAEAFEHAEEYLGRLSAQARAPLANGSANGSEGGLPNELACGSGQC
jgi:ArsR family transcriptional regulator, arsenate/arsenite/antimonite-responsive transcriptional repressor